MSLDVCVGVLDEMKDDPEALEYHRDQFAKLNTVLLENGLPQHSEPESLPPHENRCGLLSYPYSYLHQLRRAYAHSHLDPSWKPTQMDENERASLDPALEHEALYGSHLIWHSDCVGFYVPIDFVDVIGDEKERVPGGMLGSSYRLRAELIHVAPKLEIALEGNILPDAQAELINRDSELEKGLHIERIVWLSLFEAARLSIELKSAIVFR